MVIESISPHPSEEDLDVATLGPGIKCVVHKGQFKQGDRVNMVPVKTVKKGVICHGVLVKEIDYVELNEEPLIDPDALEDMDPDYNGDPLSMAEVFDGGDESIARAHSDLPEGDALFFDLDDAEEDAKNFAEDD